MDRPAGSQHQGVSRCTGEPEVDWYLSDQQNRNILGFTHAAHRISWHCPDRQAQSSPAWKISMTVLSVRSTVPPRWWRQNCKSLRKPVCGPLKLMHIRKNKSYLQEISKRSLLSCTFYKRKRMGREILTEPHHLLLQFLLDYKDVLPLQTDSPATSSPLCPLP